MGNQHASGEVLGFTLLRCSSCSRPPLGPRTPYALLNCLRKTVSHLLQLQLPFGLQPLRQTQQAPQNPPHCSPWLHPCLQLPLASGPKHCTAAAPWHACSSSTKLSALPDDQGEAGSSTAARSACSGGRHSSCSLGSQMLVHGGCGCQACGGEQQGSVWECL